MDTVEPETLYILTSIVDCTVRHQLEEKLQKAYDQLEATVQTRTEELSKSNVQLLQEIEDARGRKSRSMMHSRKLSC